MKANTKRPSLDEYDSDQFREIIENVSISALELSEYIDEKMDNIPEKGTKPYKKWKFETNQLIDKFNQSFGKRYNRVK